MALVQDFVPVLERSEQAGMVLVAGRASWLADLAAAAVAPAELVPVKFGAPRSVEHALIVPLHWGPQPGPCTTLHADIRLEPVPRGGANLGFMPPYAPASEVADMRYGLRPSALE